jgi:hypothetical protein
VKIYIKYFNIKQLLTIDVNALLRDCAVTLGERISVTFEEMTPEEQEAAVGDMGGVSVIKDRVLIFTGSDRRADIEQRIRK